MYRFATSVLTRKWGKKMKTIFQTKSQSAGRLKGKVTLLLDGAIEEIFQIGEYNMRDKLEAEKSMSILIEIQDVQTDKVIHTFLITNKEG